MIVGSSHLTPTEVIGLIFEALLAADPPPTDSEPMQNVIDRLPPDHLVHKLNALGWFCIDCGTSGFVRDLAVSLQDGSAGCPHCDSDTIMLLQPGGRA